MYDPDNGNEKEKEVENKGTMVVDKMANNDRKRKVGGRQVMECDVKVRSAEKCR